MFQVTGSFNVDVLACTDCMTYNTSYPPLHKCSIFTHISVSASVYILKLIQGFFKDYSSASSKSIHDFKASSKDSI